MKIQTKATEDPKGKKKPMKKTGTISYLLRTIMKRGGIPVADKGDKRLEVSVRKAKTTGVLGVNLHEDDCEMKSERGHVDDFGFVNCNYTEETEIGVERNGDVQMELEENKQMLMDLSDSTNLQGSTDIDNEGDEKEEVQIISTTPTNKSNLVTNTIMGSVNEKEKDIEVWEHALGQLEMELEKAATSEERKTIQKNIELAQLMIKKSLLVDVGRSVETDEYEDEEDIGNTVDEEHNKKSDDQPHGITYLDIAIEQEFFRGKGILLSLFPLFLLMRIAEL